MIGEEGADPMLHYEDEANQRKCEIFDTFYDKKTQEHKALHGFTSKTVIKIFWSAEFDQTPDDLAKS